MTKKKTLQKQKPTESCGISYSADRYITDDDRCSCGGALWDIGDCIKCGDCGYMWSKCGDRSGE